MSQKIIKLDAGLHSVQWKLTQPELLQFGLELANLGTEIRDLEEEKKASAAAYKLQVEVRESKAQTTEECLKTGIEERRMNCHWQLNIPDLMKKTLVCDETGQTVLVSDMTSDDQQTELNLDDNSGQEISVDHLIDSAQKLIVSESKEKVSPVFFKIQFNITYSEAKQLIDELEAIGVLGKAMEKGMMRQVLPFTTVEEKSEPKAEDELLAEAEAIVVEDQNGSATNLQKRLRIGFNRASGLVTLLEARGVLSAVVDGKRQVLKTNS